MTTPSLPVMQTLARHGNAIHIYKGGELLAKIDSPNTLLLLAFYATQILKFPERSSDEQEKPGAGPPGA